MIGSVAETLRAAQSPTGGFPSTVSGPRGSVVDHNCFVTAQILRSLDPKDAQNEMPDVIERALSFIRSCRRGAGGFAFWPERGAPAGFPDLPPDCDDTALSLMELMRFGGIERSQARAAALTVLAPAGRARPDSGPPWIVPGAFVTWIARGNANVVDCCANANVVGLLAALDLRHVRGYAAACETIVKGVEWAAGSRRSIKSLSPFYPEPYELLSAVTHALDRGATELAAARDALVEALGADAGRLDASRPVCSDAYGMTIWKSPLLQLVRGSERASRRGGPFHNHPVLRY